jgi:hypothetical protein
MKAGAGKDLLCFHNFDDFAALIFAAMRAGAMGANFLVAVGAIRKLGNGQRIVSATGRGTPLGMAPFWIWHLVISTFYV